MVNFDMVGRLNKENELTVFGGGEPVLQTTAGSVGIRSLVSGGASANLPVTFTYDDVQATA